MAESKQYARDRPDAGLLPRHTPPPSSSRFRHPINKKRTTPANQIRPLNAACRSVCAELLGKALHSMGDWRRSRTVCKRGGAHEAVCAPCHCPRGRRPAPNLHPAPSPTRRTYPHVQFPDVRRADDLRRPETHARAYLVADRREVAQIDAQGWEVQVCARGLRPRRRVMGETIF